MILGMCPDAEVKISYGVPRYAAPGGRYVFLGLWKQGVSLHAVNFEVIAAFKKRYPHIKTGKGSLNFKTTDEFTDAAVKKVLKKVLS